MQELLTPVKHDCLGFKAIGIQLNYLQDICSINMGQSPPFSYNENGDGLPLIQGETMILKKEKQLCEFGQIKLLKRETRVILL